MERSRRQMWKMMRMLRRVDTMEMVTETARVASPGSCSVSPPPAVSGIRKYLPWLLVLAASDRELLRGGAAVLLLGLAGVEGAAGR